MRRLIPREVQGLDEYGSGAVEAGAVDYNSQPLSDFLDALDLDPGLFKGVWTTTPDELVFEQDFDTDLIPFTGSGARVSIASAIGTSKPAGYTYTDQVSGNPSSTNTITLASIVLSAISELSGRTPTRLKVWHAQRTTSNANLNQNTTYTIRQNGTAKYTRTHNTTSSGQVITDAWSELEIVGLTSGDTIDARITCPSSSFLPSAVFAITGFKVYAEVVGWDGYDTGHFVVHAGQLWVSTADDNQTVPGASGASWTPVPLYALPVNAQTGTTYTLALTDAGSLVTMNNAGASTLTVPPNSSVAFPVGTVVEAVQLGAGLVTLTPGSGVTLTGTPIVMTPNRGVRLIKTATDTWLVLAGNVPPQALNAQTGTTYTLVAADAHRTVQLTNAAAVTLTIPADATFNFPVGTRIPYVQGGAGTVTASAAAGVTLNGSPATTGQWSRRWLEKTAANTWLATD